MQSMFGVLLLPFLLSACLNFPRIAGLDCQNTYQELAQDLIETGNNIYSLSKGFFPPDAAEPVLVKVIYHFQNCPTCDSKTWYWTGGAFYIYQPLEVFVFRSLFFSPISFRQETVELQLPESCYGASSDFFELLTQRVSILFVFLKLAIDITVGCIVADTKKLYIQYNKLSR